MWSQGTSRKLLCGKSPEEHRAHLQNPFCSSQHWKVVSKLAFLRRKRRRMVLVLCWPGKSGTRSQSRLQKQIYKSRRSRFTPSRRSRFNKQNRWNVQCLFYKLVIYMTTDASLSLLVWMPGHLGFIFLSFPLQPWGLEVFKFFQMRLNRSYRIQATNFQQLWSPQEEYTIKKAPQTTGTGTLIGLALEFPAKEGLAKPRRVNYPFLIFFLVGWREHTRAELSLGSPGSLPRAQPGVQGTPLPTWVPSKDRSHSPPFSFSFRAYWSSSWSISELSDSHRKRHCWQLLQKHIDFWNDP